MAYEKHTWVSNELITADKLNHMEDGIAAIDNHIIAESSYRTIVAGTNTYDMPNLTPNHVVARCDFTENYNEGNPPADIDIITSEDSYIITVSNLLATGIGMKLIFIKP